MMRLGPSLRHVATSAAAYIPPAIGGYLCTLAHIPLPWLIGALIVTAVFSISGRGLPVSTNGRRAGQVVLGAAIGLFFTPVTVAALMDNVGAMLFAAVFTLVMGCVAALLLMRMTGLDGATAYFASVPGGAAEMALMANRYGGTGAPVAFAQAVRVAILVTIIPPAIIWSGIAGEPEFTSSAREVDIVGLVMLLSACAVLGLLAYRARVPNGWLLGPMVASAALTGFDVQLSAIPTPLISISQILLGSSLGAMFNRDSLRNAHGFIAAAMVGNVFLIAACGALALLGVVVLDAPVASMILATAPGGVTEMGITAKALHLDVAMVSAFHVVRIFLIIPTTPFIFQVLRHLGIRIRTFRSG